MPTKIVCFNEFAIFVTETSSSDNITTIKMQNYLENYIFVALVK